LSSLDHETGCSPQGGTGYLVDPVAAGRGIHLASIRPPAMTRIRTWKKLHARTLPAGTTFVAVAIALVSAAALVAFAARQASGPDRPINRSTTSRAAINAAEEHAIWAPPRQAVADGSVTVTGCLEQDGDRFRLTDADGASVPKSRSWKSAFFKKSSAAIDIVGVRPATGIASHVGERVRIIGVLDDRQMHLRALQPLEETCG